MKIKFIKFGKQSNKKFQQEMRSKPTKAEQSGPRLAKADRSRPQPTEADQSRPKLTKAD